MPVLSKATSFRGQGYGVGMAQGRLLIKTACLQELIVADSRSSLNGVAARRLGAAGDVFTTMVGKRVDVYAEYIDGGWIAVSVQAEPGSHAPAAITSSSASSHDDVVAVSKVTPKDVSVANPNKSEMVDTAVLKRGYMSNADLRLVSRAYCEDNSFERYTQPLDYGYGVVVSSFDTFGHIKSLQHRNVFFPACSLRPRGSNRFVLNLKRGTVVKYEAQYLPKPNDDSRSSSTEHGWLARRVVCMPAVETQRNRIITGYAAICDMQPFFGYLRSSQCDYKFFFSSTNILDCNGKPIGQVGDPRRLLGQKVKFAAFFVGERRITDLQTPFVALYVELVRLRLVDRSRGGQRPPTRIPRMNHSGQGVRRSRSLGCLRYRPSNVLRYPSVSAHTRFTAPTGRYWSSRRNLYCGSATPYTGSQRSIGFARSTGDISRLYEQSSEPYIGEDLAVCIRPEQVDASGKKRAVRFVEPGDRSDAPLLLCLRNRSTSADRARSGLMRSKVEYRSETDLSDRTWCNDFDDFVGSKEPEQLSKNYGAEESDDLIVLTYD